MVCDVTLSRHVTSRDTQFISVHDNRTPFGTSYLSWGNFSYMSDCRSITNVLPNALLKKGITQHEFVGVSFINHTERKYQIWIKKLFVFAIKNQTSIPLWTSCQLKLSPFKYYVIWAWFQRGCCKTTIVQTDRQQPLHSSPHLSEPFFTSLPCWTPNRTQTAT